MENLLTSVPPDFKAGFVAVAGRPNVGKSTLINRLVGQKISIVSEKPQTTRTRLLGIMNLPGKAQIIFIDTPGIHKPLHKLGEYMVATAERSLEEADLVLFMVDVSVPPTEEDQIAADLLNQKARVPVLLVLNKGDKISPEVAEEMTLVYSPLGSFADKRVISAIRGDGLEELVQRILDFLPYSPPFYPEDQVTDQPERVISAEIIREKVLEHTYQEVPHSVAVVVEDYKERENGTLYISANIYVERESQKKIIIGAKGQLLKTIGQSARRELEAFTGRHVYLALWVKVQENWRKKEPLLRQLGYSFKKR